MKILYLVTLIINIKATFDEEAIQTLRFTSNNDLANIGLENAIVQDGAIKMRASADRGSLIAFKEKNEADEWSMEFKFDDLKLKYPEFAGIYMWYTDERLSSGNVAGTDGNFKGIMTGIEFLGKGVQILIGGNQENKKMKDLDEITLHKDTINPARFKDVEEFRIKIISTKKNYKIEIYEKDRLVYDNLRFLETPVLGDRGKGKYFSITTNYQKVSSYKAFKVKDIMAQKRTEKDEYDPLKFEAEEYKDEPRLGHDIDFNSKEVQHMISNVEHMMAYLKSILGQPGGSTVYQSAYDAKIASFESQKMLMKLQTELEDLKSKIKQSGTQILGSKIGDVEMELRNVKRVMFETQNTLNELKDSLRSNHSSVLLVLFLIFVCAFVVYMFTRRERIPEKKNF